MAASNRSAIFIEHALAECEIAGAGADLDDFAGDVGAGHERQRQCDAGHAAPAEDVVVVDRARMHAQPHPVGFERRFPVALLEHDLLQRSVLVDHGSAHVSYPHGSFAPRERGQLRPRALGFKQGTTTPSTGSGRWSGHA